MAKEKTQVLGTATLAYPDVDENGYQKVMSADGVIVYARHVDGGCEKRTIVLKDGVVESDTTEFKTGAYVRRFTCGGVVYSYELVGG